MKSSEKRDKSNYCQARLQRNFRINLKTIYVFNLLNYGFGLTKVPLRTYVFWSWICMFPGTLLFVVGADAVTKAVYEGRMPWALTFIFAFTVVIITLLVKHMRKTLKAKQRKTDV